MEESFCKSSSGERQEPSRALRRTLSSRGAPRLLPERTGGRHLLIVTLHVLDLGVSVCAVTQKCPCGSAARRDIETVKKQEARKLKPE